jgi:flagellar motor switch protein FliN/FliY
MSLISPDLIASAVEIQAKIWTAVKQSAGDELEFEPAVTEVARQSDLRGEFGGDMLLIQFAFGELPDHFQVVLMPQPTILELASKQSGKEVAQIDEDVLAVVRPTAEAVVQGICKAVGEIRGEPATMSSLTIRHQEFALPENLEALAELIRTNVSIKGKDVAGVAAWLYDEDTARYAIGHGVPDEEATDEASPFSSADLSVETTGVSRGDHNPIDILLDIPLEVSVELGRVRMYVKDVLELGTGSIVEIDKAAGEPVDVLVNGRLVAKGEVVVIEDNFGVRITEILTPNERLHRLAEVA